MSEDVGDLGRIQESLLSEAALLLAVEGVRLEDNFFDLGGHSILAARLLNRMEPVLGCRAPLRLVFEAEDMRDLSTQLAAVATLPAGQ